MSGSAYSAGRVFVTGFAPDGRGAVLAERVIGPVHPIASLPAIAHDDLFVSDGSGHTSERSSPRVPAPGEFSDLPDQGHLLRYLEILPNSGGNLGEGRHATATVDYVVVLRGEVTCVLDTEEVTLRTGDVLVQRGTPHEWINRSTTPCCILAVIVDDSNE